jgi:SAM-dependent methyltransferase
LVHVETFETDNERYSAKVTAELEHYADQEDVHDLPAIYHFWSERYCTPLFREVGFDSLNDLLDRHVAEQCSRVAPARARLVSLGAGNGDTEIGIAARLREQGVENLELVLLELNPVMIGRALTEAKQRGLGNRVAALQTDLNEWRADGSADIYFANHSLHHVVALESVFDQIGASLDPDGVLLVNDMIGRNGHVRWPEAAEFVHRIWSVTPERYRWNPFQKAPDATYPDIDCSLSGFEGVRAEDILPLLLQRFHPDVYVCFLNVADPFIDRVYGPNFDVDRIEDRAFIDALGRMDDAAIDLRLVSPTHLVGSFRLRSTKCRYPRFRSPSRTLRTSRGFQATLPKVDVVAPVKDRAQAGLDVGFDSDFRTLERELAEARARYQHLRHRKAVRVALNLAALRHWRSKRVK